MPVADFSRKTLPQKRGYKGPALGDLVEVCVPLMELSAGIRMHEKHRWSIATGLFGEMSNFILGVEKEKEPCFKWQGNMENFFSRSPTLKSANQTGWDFGKLGEKKHS